MRLAVLVLALACGCSSRVLHAPVSAETEQACNRALAALRSAKAAGEPCSVAKARIVQSEPLCPLAFTCATDGGTE